METVTLKNGAEEVKALVAGYLLTIERLHQELPMAFFGLIELCRNPNHELFPVILDALKKYNLVTDAGKIRNDSLRNIVLSASEGEGLDLTFGSPV